MYEVCNLKKNYNIDCVLNFRCPSKETVKVLKDHVVHIQRNSGECSQKKCDDTGARPLGSKLTIIVLSDVILYLYSYPNYFSIFFKSCWKCSFYFHQICYNLNQDLNFYCYCMWLISWFFILSCKFFGFCFSFSFQMYHSIFWFVRVFFLFQRAFKDLRWIWIVLFCKRYECNSSFFSVVGKWRCDDNACLLIKPFEKHNYLCQWFIFSLTKKDVYFYK